MIEVEGLIRRETNQIEALERAHCDKPELAHEEIQNLSLVKIFA